MSAGLTLDRNCHMPRAPASRRAVPALPGQLLLGSVLGIALLVAPMGVALAALPAAVAETPVPSLSPMIKRVSPAVVNISTQGTIQQRKQSPNPLLDESFLPPLLRHARARPAQVPERRLRRHFRREERLTSSPTRTSSKTPARSPSPCRTATISRPTSSAPTLPPTSRVLKVKSDKLTQMALGDSAHVEVGEFRGRHRQSVRPCAYRDVGDHQRAVPLGRHRRWL